MEIKELKINGKRLNDNIKELAKTGMNEGGGIDRALGSKADYESRQWLINYWEKKLGKKARIDAIANMWIDCPGNDDKMPIVIGSHNDAVPDGGKYDGAMGVLMATEIMETLIENNIRLSHPLSVVSFTGEEPNPFNVSTLGSKVLCGRLKLEDLKKYKNRDTGVSLEDAISQLGGDINKAAEAMIKPGQIEAFLECHIEQGKRLETAALPSAAVSCITGIYREEINVSGEANHAGTTVMWDRCDALTAAAETILAVERIAADYKKDNVVATAGYFQVMPGEANIIPGKVKMIVDIRTDETEIKDEIISLITVAVKEIIERRGVEINRTVILDQEPVKMDDVIINAVSSGIEELGVKPVKLVSMAGHDAANMARVTRSGMIFVRSIDGKSHCKEEYSTEDDIELTGNAMLNAIIKLDEEL